MPATLSFTGFEIIRGGSMDVVFLCVGALMVVAIVGMVVGCDHLGERK